MERRHLIRLTSIKRLAIVTDLKTTLTSASYNKASAEESVSLSEKMMLDDSLLGQFLFLPGVSVLIVIKLVDF